MNKPLSKAERDAIPAFITAEIRKGGITIGLTALQAAMDSEAFWRSAVRDADVCGLIGVPCLWCPGVSYDRNVAVVHRQDCAWLLAQGGG